MRASGRFGCLERKSSSQEPQILRVNLAASLSRAPPPEREQKLKVELTHSLALASASGFYSGYKMTIFSTAEEQQREPLEIGGKVLFYPDFALETAGGAVSVVAPRKSYVLQDRELISGQNPSSDEALLKLLIQAVNARRSKAAGAS